MGNMNGKSNFLILFVSLENAIEPLLTKTASLVCSVANDANHCNRSHIRKGLKNQKTPIQILEQS